MLGNMLAEKKTGKKVEKISSKDYLGLSPHIITDYTIGLAFKNAGPGYCSHETLTQSAMHRIWIVAKK